jgi:hypothetical protein
MSLGDGFRDSKGCLELHFKCRTRGQLVHEVQRQSWQFEFGQSRTHVQLHLKCNRRWRGCTSSAIPGDPGRTKLAELPASRRRHGSCCGFHAGKKERGPEPSPARCATLAAADLCGSAIKLGGLECHQYLGWAVLAWRSFRHGSR